MEPRPFEQVIEEHGAVVLRVCRAVLGSFDADDAWSETFLAALRAYPDLAPGSNVRGWLVTIAHRKAIDQLRRRARAPVPVEDVPEAGSSLGTAVDGEPELWQALAALPLKQRAAVAHHHLAGLPFAEVGRLIGSSEAAARRSSSDGIAALRRTLTTGAPR